ncbi:MAG: DUF4178 domain-containing protein [Ideonella sp.]
MATEPSPQRGYRAACPNCGAPVEFRSAASAFAVCSFCRSTVVRDGDALRRIGQSAELFDDHTPLQLGASGSYLGQPFTLIGRQQFGTEQGSWNEWHSLFDLGADGAAPRVAWLSEDNGRYVMAFDAPLPGPLPALGSLTAGRQLEIGGQIWSVASIVRAKLLAAEGELPAPPAAEFTVADFRNPQGEVATLDDGDPQQPRWSLGRSVALSELAMRGLAEASEKTLKARTVECPNCGTSLQVKLESSQSIVCSNCKAVVDISAGVGGDLQHYVQTNSPHGALPLIPLGSSGSFRFDSATLVPWQVVGYAERFELPDDPDDERVFWREYLLYNRSAGFTFLVDSEEGWSWVAPITGVPQAAGSGAVRYRDVAYRKQYDEYRAQVSYVLGEFYWRVERDQQTLNTDYIGTGSAASKRLNREQSAGGTAQEIVWSAGETLAASAVLKAFGLPGAMQAAIKRDAAPVSLNPSGLLAKAFLVLFLIAVLFALFRCDGDDDCNSLRASYGESSNEYKNCLVGRSRTGGGAFGGFSSGGFHK